MASLDQPNSAAGTRHTAPPVHSSANSTSEFLNTSAFPPVSPESQRALETEPSSAADVEIKASAPVVSGGMQPVINLMLRPGEKYRAESGAMLYRDPRISMELFHTGTSEATLKRGVLGRLMSGESVYLVEYQNTSDSPARLSLSPSKVGEMLQLNLDDHPCGLCADKGAFFSGSPAVEISVMKAAGARGFLSGMGLFQQHLSGSGDVILFSPGSIQELKLAPGESLAVDSGAVFAWEKSVDVKLQYQGFWKGLMGGEGFYTCTVTGPGKIWIASRGSEDDASSNKSGPFSTLGSLLDIFT